MTDAEVMMAREILARFERQGPPVEMSGGSMHDGSKRLRETDEWDAISYEDATGEFMDHLVSGLTTYWQTGSNCDEAQGFQDHFSTWSFFVGRLGHYDLPFTESSKFECLIRGIDPHAGSAAIFEMGC